jgi:hypothetical protein
MTDYNNANEAVEDGPISTGNNPTFKLFPNLPRELRLKIWHLIFPGPRIIKNVSVNFWGSWDGKPFSASHQRIQHPVTLFVNHESRAETLKTYRDLSKSLDICKQPVYFAPAHDAIHLGAVMSFTRAGNCVRYIGLNTAHVIEKLSHIQVLILDGLYIDEQYRTPRPANRNAAFSQQYVNWNQDDHELEGRTLAKFHGLKKLFLVMSRDNWKHEVMRGVTVERCEELFRKYFEIERQKWPDCRIPEVKIVLPGNAVIWPEEND